ncbi:hypothetical protein BuS5_00939 [Desulfosarcina sp. BuS5]|uniref:HNH endonuclease signature motif containing protein n=1 Tax=Desulfosarcina sp. BuS5 TaxID=933262 RepID=UPI0023792167|nr:HNH endonuclease signature motif containing protein [Desulfosarcina sp. BuS5]WDN87971.1 hypothetical protein BuS5_00939 [Desulfosarcina sp. BuS5]
MAYVNERPNIPAEIRRSVEVEAGHTCSVKNCIEHSYLEIHHINENRKDNRRENLILLCDKHHKMAHKGIIDRKALKEYKKLLSENNISTAVNVDLEEIKRVKEFITEYQYLFSCLFQNGRENAYFFDSQAFSLLDCLFNIAWIANPLRSFNSRAQKLQDEIIHNLQQIYHSFDLDKYQDIGKSLKYMAPYNLPNRDEDIENRRENMEKWIRKIYECSDEI